MTLQDCNFSEGPIRAACLVCQLFDSMMPPAVYTSDAHTKMEWPDHNGAYTNKTINIVECD